MKKVIRLTESQLTNIIKRVISEQTSKSLFDNLKKALEPKGFKVVPYENVFLIERGNDYDGLFISYVKSEKKYSWGVTKGGKDIIYKQKKLYDEEREGKIIYDEIMKDFAPYFNMKIRPAPYQG